MWYKRKALIVIILVITRVNVKCWTIGTIITMTSMKQVKVIVILYARVLNIFYIVSVFSLQHLIKIFFGLVRHGKPGSWWIVSYTFFKKCVYTPMLFTTGMVMTGLVYKCVFWYTWNKTLKDIFYSLITQSHSFNFCVV